MLFAGLFCATFATLLLEILDGRLLSVLTWYHLSFLAVSLAMLGMAAGAIRVFLGGQSFSGENAVRRLPRAAFAFALTMALSHVVVLTIPLSVQPVFSTIGLASLTTTIVTLTIPFYFSGMIVTIVLTRTAASIGRLYAWDLAGAAFGCLAVVPALDSGWFNLSSLVLLGAAVAAASGYFFGQSLPWRHRSLPLLLAMLLAAAGAFNGSRIGGLEVAYTKNRQVLVIGAHGPDVLEQPLVRRRAASRTVGTVPVGRRQFAGSRRAGECGVDGDRRRGRHAHHRVERESFSARLGPSRRHDASVLRAAGVGRHHRIRRRPRHPVGDLGSEQLDYGSRRQPDDDSDADREPSTVRGSRGPSGSAIRPRRWPFVPDAHERTLRCHPDVADRHLGRHRRGRVQPLGERSLHDRGLARRALPPDADGRFQRVAGGSRPDTSPRPAGCWRSARRR